MKQRIDSYRLFIYGKEGAEEYEILNQEQGQKIIMALAGKNPPKYIVIDKHYVLATSSIARIELVGYLERLLINGVEKEVDKRKVRELTQSEEETQKKFDKFFDNKNDLLLDNHF